MPKNLRTLTVLCAVLGAVLTGAAAAQLRTLPAEHRAGTMRHLQDMWVEIDGRRARLAPGAQIRDEANRVVLPVALLGGAAVRYTLDREGLVDRVWLLSPQEAARAAPNR